MKMKKEANIKDDPNKGERIFLQGKKTHLNHHKFNFLTMKGNDIFLQISP